MDQLTRVKVNKSASIDAIIPTMNSDDDSLAHSVWCGDSEGLLHRVNYKTGKVVETRLHSVSKGKYGAVDEVGILDIDYDYRLISAGMDTLKIWSNVEVDDEEMSSDNSDDDDDDDEQDDNAEDSWTDTSLSDNSDGEPSSNDEVEKDDEDEHEEVEENTILYIKEELIFQRLFPNQRESLSISTN